MDTTALHLKLVVNNNKISYQFWHDNQFVLKKKMSTPQKYYLGWKDVITQTYCKSPMDEAIYFVSELEKKMELLAQNKPSFLRNLLKEQSCKWIRKDGGTVGPEQTVVS